MASLWAGLHGEIKTPPFSQRGRIELLISERPDSTLYEGTYRAGDAWGIGGHATASPARHGAVFMQAVASSKAREIVRHGGH